MNNRPNRVPARPYLPTVMLVGLVSLLAACAQPASPPPIPTLTLTDTGWWWATSPTTPLTGYASLHVDVKFRNVTGTDITFVGADGGADPADEMQAWFSPYVSGTTPDPVITFLDFPQGDYADGEELNWVIDVDLTGVSGVNSFAFRPYNTTYGVINGALLEVAAATLTLTR